MVSCIQEARQCRVKNEEESILESSKFINSEMFVEKKANIFVFREYIIRNFSYEYIINRDSVM